MLELSDIASAAFRTDSRADRDGQKLGDRFGLTTRYATARLALGRSLALADQPVTPGALDGRVIKGDSLFGSGADLSTWVSLLVQRTNATTLKEMQTAVGAHWASGVALLQTDLASVGNDDDAFWQALAETAGLPLEGAPGSGGVRPDPEMVADAIDLSIGPVSTDIENGERVVWQMNAKASPSFAFMGGSGQGKTSTAVQMLAQLRQQAPVPLLAFDLKGDLAAAFGLDRAFGATVLQPPRTPVPLDVFALPTTADKTEIAGAAVAFRDCFAKLKSEKLGARQSAALTEALETMLAALRTRRAATLVDLKDALIRVYKRRETKPDGALALIEELARFPLFTPEQQPAEFFSRSWIVSMPTSTPDSQRFLVTNLLLSALDRWLNGLPDAPITNGRRAVRIVVMLDEAHLVLPLGLPALRNLVRISRSKGGVIALLSQAPDDFKNEDDDFLANLGLVATFATNASDAPVRKVFGQKLDLPGLLPGVCAIRMVGQKTRLVQAFTPTAT